MKQLHCLCVALVLFTLTSTVAFAQSSTTVSGSVTNNKTKEALSAVSVTIKGGTAGTFTDDKGNFKFTTTQKPPFTLIISSVGYAPKEVAFDGSTVSVGLETNFVLGEEVVVAASRVPERILESPVSIERISSANIRQSPATNYYDIVGNLKGVDVTTSSLTFKTISTRGFNSSGNLRLNQIMDGMDNQAPGLNFAVGSIIGLTELDVDNVELLAGASSALYGPGGMNGTLLINSKNPFKYQGLSFQIKTGVNHIDGKQRDPAAFNDWNVRWAQKISEKWAFKIGASFTQATDWVGNDKRNFQTAAGGDRTTGQVIAGDRSDPAYDGVNVYGDETNFSAFPAGLNTFKTFAQNAVAPLFPGPYQPALANIIASIPATQNVSRTGYDEKDVISPLTVNVKLTGALHYKITDNLEASIAANYGIGNTVYTGLGRYSLKNFRIGQYKFELKSKNWYVRAYTTQEDAGDSYNASAATQYFNEKVKPSSVWFGQYTQAYLTNRLGGASDAMAHAAARAVADAGRPTGNLLDNPIFNQVISTPISKGGGLFVDKTSLYMYEGQYNLTDALGLAKSGTEFLVGGNYKEYRLNSEGTLFADTAGKIKIAETGVYGQLSQKVFNDVLKLTVSGRYDKNENFAGRFTPRASAVIKVAENQNIRVSYQQAYRFPSTQNQWIKLNVGAATLLGGLPQLRNYVFGSAPVYDVRTNAPATFGEFKPETATSYEIGYKGLIGKKLLLDVYGYTASYDNFIGGTNVYQIVGGAAKVYQVSTNSTGKVTTRGYGVSLDYLLPQNFTIGANFYSDEISDIPTGFVTFFNTPKYRTNITFGNTGFGPDKRLGFSLVYRWQDSFYYEGTFGAGDLPSVITFDGQISYKFPATKSILKIGATNMFNRYYTNGFGNAQIGGLYYASFAFNVF
ncbi:TonB-dependent receptor [Parasediminibacterium paludis]|uniref:TonB-dependent receptor n=1 Tax=Parasediminibacterium paludis TaxID=908966 RepID=A0ABV8PUC8_9BACT